MVAKSPYLIDKGFDHTVVPGAGLEPARSKERGILNPLCLPISPPGHLLLVLLIRLRRYAKS